jgi:BirA family biotin operon repressor/biotin-[acetyl-CoA-carboxylase] ligase
MTQPIDPAGEFHEVAKRFPDPFRLLIRQSTASTNDDARELAAAGAPDGRIVLALEQTAGRGRRGAAWFSEPHESLALSIVLRPAQPKALWPRLALASGLAVAEALEFFGAATGIKWPNDVWIGEKKTAGILVEAGPDFAIVGIGLNIGTRHFPTEVRDIATSLDLATGRRHSRAEVLVALIGRLAHRRHQIGADFEQVLDAVRQRCVLRGHRVSFLVGDQAHAGTVEGIAHGGELLIRGPHGIEKFLQADEIRILG